MIYYIMEDVMFFPLRTLVTKYTYILIFDFGQIIYPQHNVHNANLNI